MAQPSNAAPTVPTRLDKPVRWVAVVAIVLIAAGFFSLVWIAGQGLHEAQAQREERDCRFNLTTITDKVDSDILVKQAQIFEAAILRPNPEGGATPEMTRLGTELHTLIEDRTVAYTQRENAESRCD